VHELHTFCCRLAATGSGTHWDEIHNVLTQARSGLLTISVILAIYFSSSGVEAVRIGLNRAYDVRDSRSWWLLRLESIAYIFVVHSRF